MPNNPSNLPASRKVRTALSIFYALPVVLVLAILGYFFWLRAQHHAPPSLPISSAPFATVAIDNLTATLFAQGEHLLAANNDLSIEFRDKQNNLVDVGEVRFELKLTSPEAVMHSLARVNPTDTPGKYRTSVQPQMPGNWTCTLGYSGPHGAAETNFPTVIK